MHNGSGFSNALIFTSVIGLYMSGVIIGG